MNDKEKAFWVKEPDLVEVVRCKYCKMKQEYSPTLMFCGLTGIPIDEDDFCSYGERITNGQE